MYVLEKDSSSNTITLGEREQLFKSRITVGDINLIAIDRLLSPLEVRVKIRYGQTAENAVLHPLGKDAALIEFERPQWAPAPGQAAVFYDGDIVIGGGTIWTQTAC
jgi:tRNA-specific 2-thiouridylase